MLRFVHMRKYLSMVDTRGILDGHGHHQETSTVASGQRMSQDDTVMPEVHGSLFVSP